MTIAATPLQQQIDEFNAQAGNHLPAELVKDLRSPIAQLIATDAAAQALTEGALAPDFSLPDARGNTVRLSHLLRQGPVVLTFYRGGWCPYCNLQLRAYQQALPRIQELGASLVAISPQTPDHSLSTIEKNELSFTILSDVGNMVSHRFGLVFAIDAGVHAAHLQVGANLPAFNGDASWELPMAGTFIIDPSGTVRLAFVDPDFTRRLEPAVLLARLNEIHG